MPIQISSQVCPPKASGSWFLQTFFLKTVPRIPLIKSKAIAKKEEDIDLARKTGKRSLAEKSKEL